MRHPRLKWSLGLAAAGLLVLLVARHLSAQSNVAAELAVLRGLGHPTSLAELVARHPVVPAAENAGPALEAVVDQVIPFPKDDRSKLWAGCPATQRRFPGETAHHAPAAKVRLPLGNGMIDDGANPTAAALLGDSHPSLRRQPELPGILREKSDEPARSERL